MWSRSQQPSSPSSSVARRSLLPSWIGCREPADVRLVTHVGKNLAEQTRWFHCQRALSFQVGLDIIFSAKSSRHFESRSSLHVSAIFLVAHGDVAEHQKKLIFTCSAYAVLMAKHFFVK